MKKKSNQGVLPAAPYVVWSSLFIVIPLLIIIFFSFTIKTDTGYKFSLENYEKLMNPNYFSVFGRRPIYNCLFNNWISSSLFNC